MKKILSLLTAMALVLIVSPTDKADAATIYYNKGTSGVPVWTTNSAELSQANWADNSPIVRETDTGNSTVTASVEDPNPTLTTFLPTSIVQGTGMNLFIINGTNLPSDANLAAVYLDNINHDSLMPAGTTVTLNGDKTQLTLNYAALPGGVIDTSNFVIDVSKVALRLNDGSVYKSDASNVFTVEAPASNSPVILSQNPQLEGNMWFAAPGSSMSFAFNIGDDDSNSVDYDFTQTGGAHGAWVPNAGTLDTSSGSEAFSSEYTFDAANFYNGTWALHLDDGANETTSSNGTFYSVNW